MACTPLSLGVPPEGTEHQIGIQQIENYLYRQPNVRSQYRRFRGPFWEDLTIEDLKRRSPKWKGFWQRHPRDERRQLDLYTVPGSLLALCERMDENLFQYMVILTLLTSPRCRCCR